MTISATRRQASARRIATFALWGLLAALFWSLAGPTWLGGPVSYVITTGSSMAPHFRDGDLVVVRESESVGVGDVAAYRSPLFDAVVLHRVVGLEDGRLVFKGDNNSWIDPEIADADQLIGVAVLRVPRAGTAVRLLTSPAALGLYAFALVAGGTTAVGRRHRRRRRRSTAMAQTTQRSIPTSVATLPLALQVAAAVTAIVGLLALVVGGVSWTTPTRESSVTDRPTGAQMTFAYSAAVGRSAAYDGTTAESPRPIFRRLADSVDVTYLYSGPPGRIAVDAVVTAASGWTSRIPLEAETAFSEPTFEGTTRLDLSALEDRADAASDATGIPSGQLSVTIEPTITSATGATFVPTLALRLDPLALFLVGDRSALTVADASSTSSSTEVASTLSFLGVTLAVSTARTLSAVLALLVLLAVAGIALVARRSGPTSEDEVIRRRWSALLVRVHPMAMPAGRPVVEVAEPSTLVKLAERYGLLVLHWTRSGIETYVVQDDAVTYRYRAGATAPPAATVEDVDVDGAPPAPERPHTLL